jgi:hypothetical protein
MPKCPECQCENPEGTPLCRECGATLPIQPAEEPAEEAATEPSVEDAELLGLLNAGKKVSAVKLYRERHGVGLKEAKDAVEALAGEHGIAAQGSGCAGMVLLAITGLAAATWCLLA